MEPNPRLARRSGSGGSVRMELEEKSILSTSQQLNETQSTVMSSSLKESFQSANELRNNVSDSIREMKARLEQIKRQSGLDGPSDGPMKPVERPETLAPIQKRSISKTPKKPSVTKRATLGEILNDMEGRSVPRVTALPTPIEEEDEGTDGSTMARVREIVRQQFGLQTLYPFQHEALRLLLEGESVLLNYQTGAGKNLVYQLYATLSEGLIVVISANSAYLALRQDKLDGAIPSALFTSALGQEDKKELLEYVRSATVRILFLTLDRLLNETLSDVPAVSLVVIEEAQILSDLAGFASSRSTTSPQEVLQHIRTKLSPSKLMIFSRNLGTTTLTEIQTRLELPPSNILHPTYKFDNKFPLTITRDDDRQRGMLLLIKNSRFKSLGQTYLVLCNNKKGQEEAFALLTANGVRALQYAGAKTDAQLATLPKNSFNALVAISGQQLNFDRNLFRAVIFYSMPASPEEFVADVLPPGYRMSGSSANDVLAALVNENGDDDHFVHMFCSDEDCQRMRNTFFSEMVEKFKLIRFVSKVDEVIRVHMRGGERSQTPGASRLSSKPGVSPKPGVAPKPGMKPGVKAPAPAKGVGSFIKGIKKPEPQEQPVTPTAQSVKSPSLLVDEELFVAFKLNELCNELDLRKDVISLLFTRLFEDDATVHLLHNIPTQMNIKFVHVKPETLTIQHPLIKFILESKRNGIYKANLYDLSTKMSMPLLEVYKQFKSLVAEGIFTTETCEEAFCVRFVSKARIGSYAGRLEELYQWMNTNDLLRIRRFDFLYALVKLSSFPGMDHLLTKVRNESKDNLKLTAKASVGGMSVEGDGKTLRKDIVLNLLESLEKYFNHTGDTFEDILTEVEVKIEEVLPVVRISTQREKSTIHGDFCSLIREKKDFFAINQSYVDYKGFDGQSQYKFEVAKNLVRIVQGIPTYRITLNEWKASKYWDKYAKFDYKDLLEIALEAVQTNFASIPTGIKGKK